MQIVVSVPFWWLIVKYATNVLIVLMFVVYLILFGFSWSPFTPTIYSMPIVAGCFIAGVLSIPFFMIRGEKRARKRNHDRVYARLAAYKVRPRSRNPVEDAKLLHQCDLEINRLYPL